MKSTSGEAAKLNSLTRVVENLSASAMPKQSRADRYAAYCRLCYQNGMSPLTFRRWAESDDEYEREWEVASYEYEHAGEQR